MTSATPNTSLVDTFGRKVDYLRVSVTDRCNFRCVYCMAEDMTFVPKNQVLTLEEILRIVQNFVALGVTKVRLTGGEPLIRHNLLWLIERLGALPSLENIALTTNGALLPKYAEDLKRAGVTRLNISIDSLDEQNFARLTRFGKLGDVLDGIDAAQQAGLTNIRLNAVILKGINDDETLDLVNFAREKQVDIAFIEEMPLGMVERDREGESVSSDELLSQINASYHLQPIDFTSGGPARYFRLANDGDNSIRVGFISPHSHNFCATCNRVRLTAEGRLLLCLGNEHSIDLREPVRVGISDAQLQTMLVDSLNLKPERHWFDLSQQPQILRFMNATGG